MAKMENDQLVVGVLKCVERVVSTYSIQNKIFLSIRLGSEGMGPNITVEFQGSRYDETSPSGDITFWLHPHNDAKFVLIYTMFDPKSGIVDHQSVDLSELSEADSYFDRAISVFDLKPN